MLARLLRDQLTFKILSLQNKKGGKKSTHTLTDDKVSLFLARFTKKTITLHRLRKTYFLQVSLSNSLPQTTVQPNFGISLGRLVCQLLLWTTKKPTFLHTLTIVVINYFLSFSFVSNLKVLLRKKNKMEYFLLKS